MLVPLLLPLSGGWLTALHVLAIVTVGVGAGGALADLAKLRNRPELEEIGIATSLLALAGGFLIIRVSHELPYFVVVLLVIAIVALGALGVIFFFVGLAKGMSGAGSTVAAGSSPSVQGRPVNHEHFSRRDILVLGVTAFCGLLAAATTIIGAYIAKG